jgi:hypothetical protein
VRLLSEGALTSIKPADVKRDSGAPIANQTPARTGMRSLPPAFAPDSSPNQ